MYAYVKYKKKLIGLHQDLSVFMKEINDYSTVFLLFGSNSWSLLALWSGKRVKTSLRQAEGSTAFILYELEKPAYWPHFDGFHGNIEIY